MDIPDPGIEPGSPALQADSLSTELSGSPKENAKVEIITEVWCLSFNTLSLRFRCQIGICFHRSEVQIREYSCGDYLPMGDSRNHGHG